MAISGALSVTLYKRSFRSTSKMNTRSGPRASLRSEIRPYERVQGQRPLTLVPGFGARGRDQFQGTRGGNPCKYGWTQPNAWKRSSRWGDLVCDSLKLSVTPPSYTGLHCTSRVLHQTTRWRSDVIAVRVIEKQNPRIIFQCNMFIESPPRARDSPASDIFWWLIFFFR